MRPDLERREAYVFELPEEQIAARPPEVRGTSRLLRVEPDGGLVHGVFSDVVQALREGDLLVVNRVRVKPARLEARKGTGGRVELLVLGHAEAPRSARCMYKTRRKLKPGQELDVVGEGDAVLARVTVLALEPGAVVIQASEDIDAVMERAGALPLPPYIVKRREAMGIAAEEAADRERYQTVYARDGFAVAAPTAGLHFTREILEMLEARGVERGSLRLDVGVGTFTPIRTEELSGHEMHAERYVVDAELVDAVRRTRERGGRVIAVGTTVVRALEDQMSRFGELREGVWEARIFIRPGYRFGAVDGMVTNFHLPGSTLMAMVCAFGGYERMMSAYAEAIREGYRFYSYGDAMVIWPKEEGA